MGLTHFLKGIHYRNSYFYNALDLLKLGREYDLRFQIAARYINPGESVVDVCAGPGRLKDFLFKDCTYTVIDASHEFCATLQRKGIPCIVRDLHSGWPQAVPGADVLVMIISLSQFRKTSVDDLLENFKRVTKRVLIVEDVLSRSRSERSFFQRAINYLCGTDYYVPVVSWYTRPEFEQLMRDHGYQCEAVSSRYMIGSYGFSNKTET